MAPVGDKGRLLTAKGRSSRSGLERRGRVQSVGSPVTREDPRLASRLASMLERVRSCGLKLTPQRIAIARELAADPTHPTAQELFERLRPSLPTMSFATVYNTLDALAREGLCAALSLSPGAARFDANMEAHHHAVCDQCGLVRDVAPGAPITPITPSPVRGKEPGPVPLPVGFDVRAVEMIYRGLCAECAEAKTPRIKRGEAAI